jgi:hypothetical protein
MPLPTVTGSLTMCGPGPGPGAGQMGALRLHPSRVAEGPEDSAKENPKNTVATRDHLSHQWSE